MFPPDAASTDPSRPRRVIAHHDGTLASESIIITAAKALEACEGGAPSSYGVTFLGGRRIGFTLPFQNGPVEENRPNGLTNEALLAVVADRLECFQAGPYPCSENAAALKLIGAALMVLKSRTRRRRQQGIEGQLEEKPAPAGPSPAQIEQAAESLARRFHEAYERLAPNFGYETRPESAKPWEQVPEQNRLLMKAVCMELMAPAP